MPFQVTFSNRSRLLSQVILLTAGEDQFHICTPTIYLEAIVVGNITGHSVQWEQLSGTPVVLFDSNTLTPYFNVVDGTDKSFRVWIDKNTPLEQFDDVNIIKTPTSDGYFAVHRNQQYFGSGINPSAVTCEDITPFVDVYVPPPTTIRGEETGSVTSVIVSWQHPGNVPNDSYISQYVVMENGIAVDYIPDVPIFDAGEGTGPPSEPLEYVGTFAQYRIDTYYNIAGFEYVRESCTQDFSGLVAPTVVAINDAVDKVSVNRDQQYFTRTNFSNIVVNETDIPVVASLSRDQQFINITRTDPSGIGSG